ncbi:hypothetical protein R1flu_013893 [Riccia fluitans]|uniref:Disease resistance R13L4/SHOC-2-like LRR domain-containing protein n=1 Tax=Riccia fluitans TaxID=41844 RepID=A0ABD1YEP2_9MARC
MDRITRQPSESVSEIERESSGTADSGAHALGDKFYTAFASMCRKINDSVYELYRPSTADMNTNIDIVFFHGLQLKQDATPYLSTWRSRDAERSLWPSKWLAEDYPTARILSVHYDGSMKKTDRDGRMDLYLVAESLLHSLLLAGVGQSRPVILVGHSFGGLVIKKLCVISADQARRGKRPAGFTFFNNITGIFFYATPHQGSRLADVEKFDSQEGELVSVVRIHNTELARLNEHFESLDNDHRPWDIDIASVGEIVPSDMDEGRYVIVEEASARHPGTFTVLQEDHFSICQPQERTNTSYQTLVDFILQVQQKRRNFSEDFCGDIQPLPKTQVGLLASWYEGEINKSFEEHQAIGLWYGWDRGLPLILNVIGQYLKTTQEKGIWKETLESLRKVGEGIHEDEVRKKLQVSYDQLGKEEKEMFMDVASIFSDYKFSNMIASLGTWTLAEAKAVWRVLHGNEHSRWKILVDRALVYQVTDEDSEVKMHEHLQALGRKLARDKRRSDSIQHTSVYHISKMVQEKALYHEKLQQLDVWVAPFSRTGIGEKTCGSFPSRPKRSVLQKLMPCIRSLQFAPSISFRKMQNLRYLHVSGFTDISEGLRLELPENLVIFESRIPIESCSFQPSTQLAVLLLEDFRGRYLPNSFSNFKDSLHFLDFRAERLESLPESFSHLKMLRECALHCPLLRELPGSFGSLESLKQLILECDILEMLPDSFGNLDNLKVLKLHDCHNLERLPDSICRLRELHMMELLNCRNLEELPIDIGCLENIQSLIIKNAWGSRGGKLQSLPDSLGNLPNLQRLSVENTDVKELPSSIGDLQSLEHLTVSNKQLQELPASLGRLEKLQVLEVNFSDLKELPASIGDLESLERLTVCSTRLQGLPSRLGDLRGLKSLVVRSEALEDTPFSLSRLQSLEDLVLISQRLERLPDNWANLKKLQSLDLQCPEVFTLPDSWEALPELRRMKLSCLSKSLTGRWGGMAALQMLEVSLCRELTSFHDSLDELKALHTLRISFCDELRSLPESVGRLEMLQRLTVKHCAKLESLPESLGQLTTLKELSLYDLPLIRRIPSLHTISSLNYVIDRNLPELKSPPNVPPKCRVFHYV